MLYRTTRLPPLNVYSLLGSMSAPLFQGGLLRAQLHYAEAHYTELLQIYRKAAFPRSAMSKMP